ncbi:hypothetical protein B0T20DRAFT_209051 [Sordaria brevicollis]|uniref:Uncharacterized protein n=1 Tax=Sordaria brevicollis TaxID=83679 RepID=A0AAE0UBX0_SORBR|nr:hypothetical protein B0T20DRAFT_209051 [Sordaria brevicollis]
MSSPTPTASEATSTVEQPSSVVTPFPDSTVAAIYKPDASLLTGTCATPEFTLLDLKSSAVYAPFLGCVNSKHGCCPSQPQTSVAVGFNDVYPKAPNPEQAALDRCPADYTSISATCCPHGYTLWTTDLGGLTPCITFLPAAMTTPLITSTDTASSTGAKETIVISDVVYAIGFPVQAPISSFPAEAIAGTVATVVGLLLISALAIFLHKRKQRKEFLDLSNELNDLYGPRYPPEPEDALHPGVQASGSSSFQDDRTVCASAAYSRKSKDSDRSQPKSSPFDGHQFVVPSISLPSNVGGQNKRFLNKSYSEHGSIRIPKLRVMGRDDLAPQSEQGHLHKSATENDLPTPSPFELDNDKPQLPALSRQKELNADEIVNTSSSGDDTFVSTTSSYHSAALQGMTVETARPERLSRAFPKIVNTPGTRSHSNLKKNPSSNSMMEEQKNDDDDDDDGKKLLDGQEKK